jgi:single-stranded DNA-binding protein
VEDEPGSQGDGSEAGASNTKGGVNMSGRITVHGEGCYVNKPAEVKETSTGKLYARFTALSSTDKKLPNGQYEHGPTNFKNIEAWGDHARYAEQNLSEGKASIDFVGVEVVEEWVNKDGGKKTITKVKIWDKGGTLKLHEKQSKPSEPSAHEKSKANGYQPEQIVREPEASEGEDDADIPF